jgi:hypothetical protein
MKNMLNSSDPNSWGKTDFGAIARKILYDKEIDVQNGVKKRSFIQQFLVTYITGVKLRNQMPHSKKSMVNSHKLTK